MGVLIVIFCCFIALPSSDASLIDQIADSAIKAIEAKIVADTKSKGKKNRKKANSAKLQGSQSCPDLQAQEKAASEKEKEKGKEKGKVGKGGKAGANKAMKKIVFPVSLIMIGPTVKVDEQAVPETKNVKQGSMSAFQRKLQKEQALHQAQMSGAAAEKAKELAELKEKAKLSDDFFTLDGNTCASAVCTICVQNAETKMSEKNDPSAAVLNPEEILQSLLDKNAVVALLSSHIELFFDT